MTVPEKIAKINPFLAAGVAVLGAATWFQPGVAGSDLWWHLAAGRDILAEGQAFTTDIYSYTFQGEHWLNPEWLWAVLYWCFYELNPQAVAWLNLGVVTAVFGLAYAHAQRVSGSHLAAGAAVWLAAAASHWFLDIRPHLFTLLFLGVFLLTRERRWAPWFWPVLVAIWANTHGGFVFGIGAIGLYVLVETIQQSLNKGQLVIPQRQWIGVALCFVTLALNPYGYFILEYPLAYMDANSPFRSIIEWEAPERLPLLLLQLKAPLYSFDLGNFHGRFWLTVAAAALGLPLAFRRQPYVVALCCVTFWMAFTSRRFIPLFSITAMPLIALAVAYAKDQLARQWKVLGSHKTPRTQGLATRYAGRTPCRRCP